MIKREADRSILLCHDVDDRWQDRSGLVVYWDKFSDDSGTYSLPELVERHEEILKSRYLNWLTAFGQSDIQGKTVVEHLQLRDDFSFWWTTLLIEKSQWKSPAIYDVFRVMALEQLQKDVGFTKIVFSLDNANTMQAVKEWCDASDIEIEIVEDDLRESSSGISALKLFKLLPYSLQGFVGLLHYFCMRLPLKWSRSRAAPGRKENKIGFVSYLFNLNRVEAKQGVFYSAYWTSLHDLLKQNKVINNWLHIFVKSSLLPNAIQASKLLRAFNNNCDVMQSHQALEFYLSLRLVRNVLRDYFYLLSARRKLVEIKSLFVLPESNINVWPLLQYDWEDSVCGKTAVLNCLYLNLFEAVAQVDTRMEQLYYIMENQGWERCLVYAWKKYQKGELIGVTHATIKDWDLRHAYSYDSCSKDFKLTPPTPDKIAVNGKAAFESMRRHGFPESRLVSIEALRYLYLHNIQKENNLYCRDERTRLLVLGDSRAALTEQLLDLLNAAVPDLPDNLEILFKSHPLCRIKLSSWPQLEMIEVSSSLESIVDRYDVALTSISSSAAVDAYLAGKLVISVRDPDSFNMSPLRGFSGVEFISSAAELLKALKLTNSAVTDRAQDYFYTDPSLHYWSSLLGCCPLRLECGNV